MRRKIAAIRRSVAGAFVLGGALGAIVFLGLWGSTPLNPKNLEWLVKPFGTDLSFAAIGSLRFLKEGWSFPLGLIHGLLYPLDTSVVYVDSIPLAAVLAKLAAGIWGDNFQYFGLWGIFCMMMQGGVSAVILHKYCNDILIAAVGSLFFLFCPFLLGKMFGHVSMSGQWIILIAIAIVQYRSSDWVARHHLILWTALSAVSAGILVYFTPMVLLLAVLFYWLRATHDLRQTAKQLTITLLLSAAASLLMLWIMGGFLPGSEVAGTDYGLVPYNLNGLFNPGWASKLIKGFPAGSSTGEAYSWLGLGVIIALVYVSLDRVLHFTFSRTELVNKRLPFAIVGLTFIGFAATNKVMFGDTVVLSYPLPNFAQSAFSAFRSSARFIWPVWFLIVTWSVGGLLKSVASPQRKLFVLAGLVCVQLWDGSDWVRVIKNPDLEQTQQPLHSHFWQNMGREAKHLFIVPFTGNLPHPALAQLAYEAVRQDMTTNTFWLGRYPMQKIVQNVQIKLDEIKSGNIRKEDLFLINYIPVLAGAKLGTEIGTYLIDDQLVIGGLGLENRDPEVKKVSVEQISRSDYLNHLRSLGETSLVILSGRQTSIPVAWDDDTWKNLDGLNLHAIAEGNLDFNYVAVISAGKTVFEKLDDKPITFAAAADSRLGEINVPTNIEVSVDLNFGAFPRVRVGDLSASRSFVGLNICVYDLVQKRVTEVGTFDFFGTAPGVYLRM